MFVFNWTTPTLRALNLLKICAYFYVLSDCKNVCQFHLAKKSNVPSNGKETREYIYNLDGGNKESCGDGSTDLVIVVRSPLSVGP